MKKLAGVALLAAVPAVLLARPHVWLIGGGPTPEAAEAQIEFNVVWVLETLDGIAPEAVVRVFYANGNGPEMATREGRPRGDPDPIKALARVLDPDGGDNSIFRPHRVPGVLGPTTADSLIPALERQFRELKEGDRALIVYNGHGSWDPDRSLNALRLWGESSLTVREFERLLSLISPAVPVRFIFTQCFSGAFERAVHPDASDVKVLASGQRCGFLAESSERESEGCSASIEIGDYRDYTTYFFAALTGRTRLGEPIEGNPDRDADGRVTPYEAHLYTLSHAYNGDLPRSTSEVYLERWRPWYLRWVTPRTLPENDYGRVARLLAQRNNLPEDGPALARAIERRHEELAMSTGALEAERQRLEGEVEGIQDRIQVALLDRWPELGHPYSEGYRTFLVRNLGQAESLISAHPEYAGLAARQERLSQVEVELIDRDRQITQLEMIRRTRMLAVTLQQFRRLASGADRAAYQQLQACESLPL